MIWYLAVSRLLKNPSMSESLTTGSPERGTFLPSRLTQTSSLPSLPHFLLLTVFTAWLAPSSESRVLYLLVMGERQAGWREEGSGLESCKRARSWPSLEGWSRRELIFLEWGPRTKERESKLVLPWRRQGAGTRTLL